MIFYNIHFKIFLFYTSEVFVLNAQEKEVIFNLLKTASDNFYGYSSPDFLQKPNFKDDVKVSAQNFEEKTEKLLQNSQVQEQKNPISMEILKEKINSCTRCSLCKTRNHVVPGTGVEGSSVLVIGEGPGEEEDKQGLPFVGRAGQLLDKMLAAIQLDRNINCYIVNIVKCRPPYNRDPLPEEASACKSFLDAQIHILKPKMILALGKVAVRNLMGIQGEFSLNRYRGKIFEYQNIPVIVTYHPSALLRNLEFKKPAWEDLKFFKAQLLSFDPEYAKNFVQKVAQ